MQIKFKGCGRNNNSFEIEFSNARLSWYQEISKLWEIPEGQANFTKLLKVFNKPPKEPIHLNESFNNLIKKLEEIGFITLTVNKKPLFKFHKPADGHMTLVDVEFASHLFYNEHDNSEVLKLIRFNLLVKEENQTMWQEENINFLSHKIEITPSNQFQI